MRIVSTNSTAMQQYDHPCRLSGSPHIYHPGPTEANVLLQRDWSSSQRLCDTTAPRRYRRCCRRLVVDVNLQRHPKLADNLL